MLSTLKTLLVQHNFLTGRPDTVFNTSSHLLLTAVDLSFNDFTGPIPSRVFELPVLEAFASAKTCFSGPLPQSLCNASSLLVLLMDGVNSGEGCQRVVGFGKGSKAYVSTNGAVTGGETVLTRNR